MQKELYHAVKRVRHENSKQLKDMNIVTLQKFAKADPIGRPYVAPEWQLLFKSKNPREHDELDFQLASYELDIEQTLWLKEALTKTQETENGLNV